VNRFNRKNQRLKYWKGEIFQDEAVCRNLGGGKAKSQEGANE
jgi:hypothetical protein